ncbi:hypothetical protein M413DRAFT_25786 [Hebeloma cylindrosporum]|uniref:Uncharacterized protein n=1 Tax=Hebeloma cylindrosporum TaxID=76867 RepID=A0A0C3CKQ2_HEBCY|nr:hypothetical protein M413DRAFT_25786 [Hebeloma cylindrosporum h7]
MNKDANPASNSTTLKTPNRKSAAGNAGKSTGQRSRTKENQANSASSATPTMSRRHPLGDVTAEETNLAAMNQRMLQMEAALKKAEAEKAALTQKLADSTSNVEGDSEAEQSGDVSAADSKTEKQAKIPCPSAGFNIQAAMGLSGSDKRRRRYNAILRTVKELAGNAKLNWELEWAEIPVRAKSQFFEVVRESIPYMSRYVNDWATEAIVRQWMKNKRSYAVKQGFLEVKEKWDYLKDNAAKRTNAPRGNGKRKATSQVSDRAAKKARLSKTLAKAKGKKVKNTIDSSDDDEDEDEDEGPAGKKKGDGSEDEDDE